MAVQIYSKVGDRYKLNVEGLNTILKNVEDLPIAIYSVCGPLRQGKSFLLSVFLRFLKSGGKPNWIREPLEDFFKFRSGSVRETTGIFIWGEPFVLTKSDGSKIALLLVDSQGSFDNQTTMQENAIIFGLCTLLSSHLIFNLKNQISEDILQFLQFFAGFTRLAVDDEVQDDPFQKLVFLIRDFEHDDYSFGYYDDKVSIGGKNFKKDYIDPQVDSPPQVKYVHEMILDTFATVGVYLMPHPGQELARNGNFDLNKIDSEFLDHLEKLTSDILNPDKLAPKVIGGQVVDGKQLKLLVKNWAKAFSEKLPETKTLFESAAAVQHEMAKDAAVKNYDRRLKEIVEKNKGDGLPADCLLDIHRQVSEECIALFNGFKKIGDKSTSQEYLEMLKAEFATIFEVYRQLNAGNIEMAAIKANAEAIRNDLELKLNATTEQLSKLREDQIAEREKLNAELSKISAERAAAEALHQAKLREMENLVAQQRQQMQQQAHGRKKKHCAIA